MLIGDILDVWKQGKAVADPTKWKKRGVMAGVVSTLLTAVLAVAAGFGYSIPVDPEVVRGLAEGIASLLCLFATGLHVTTSEKVGLPAKRVDQPDEAGGNVSGVDLLGHD